MNWANSQEKTAAITPQNSGELPLGPATSPARPQMPAATRRARVTQRIVSGSRTLGLMATPPAVREIRGGRLVTSTGVNAIVAPTMIPHANSVHMTDSPGPGTDEIRHHIATPTAAAEEPQATINPGFLGATG